MKYEQALSRAAALCSQSEQCESQITEKLRRWETSEADIARIIAYLYDENYLDTGRFCRAFVSDKLRQNHWGRLKIRMALRQLRLPEADIEQALQVDDEEYADILRHVLAVKARTLHDTDSYVRRTKLLRHASSRGFEAEVVFDLLPE